MSIYRGRGRGRGIFLKPNNRCDDKKLHKPPENDDLTRTQPTTTKSTRFCNKISINLDLDPETEAWLTQLKTSWNLLKKSPSVVSMIHLHFDRCLNPYEEVLRLMYNCQDFKYAKPKSLTYLLIEEFKIWLEHKKETVYSSLTSSIKTSAFNIIQQQSLFSLKKLVAEIFEMTKDCDIFLDIIKEMIDRKQYKEACQSAALLGLHDKFTIEDFLLPLILQDKLTCVDEFLEDSPQHQVDLVSYLDSLLGQPVSIRNAIEPLIIKYKITEIKWEKVHYKPWRKLVTRLVKMYNMPSDISPCLNKKRNEGALQFLLHKRFVENSFGDESWKEMIQEAVKDDTHLQQELVAQVAIFGDLNEALHWAEFYNLPREDWPTSVRHLHENPERMERLGHNKDYPSEIWTSRSNVQTVTYHQLSLSIDDIKLLDTEKALEDFLDYGLRDVRMVGLDCEWKPSFGLEKSELSLLQIATRNSVFILDVIKLGNKAANLWQELGKFLFNNSNILKLGFSFTSDFAMIKQSIPSLTFNQKQLGYLDLLSLWKQVAKSSRVKLPFEVESKGPSLSTLVSKCLGRPLDKSDQFSNWEKRPLRESQLIYASLDAYCLLEVYDVLRSCSESVNFPFDDTCYNLMSSPRVPKKKPKRHMPHRKIVEDKHIIAQSPSPNATAITVNDVKFVCDTMLQGLGKLLRKCGIDTVILDNHMDHMECVKYYDNEKRCILTRGQIFNKLMGYTPPGLCFRVESDDINEQLKSVLQYYKIEVQKQDVFSRCQMCNNNKFVHVTKSTMNALLSTNNKKICYPPPDYMDDQLEDEATGFSSDDDLYDECTRVPINTSFISSNYVDDKIDIGLCKTKSGARILIDAVPIDVINKLDLFYICEDCGKVYWDGSHYDRVLSSTLQDIVK